MQADVEKAFKSKIRKVLEVPNCSICLDPLQKELSVFVECGHVFHHPCAINANQSSRRCPICRYRSTEIKKLHFQVEEIDGVEQQMQDMLSSLTYDEQFKVADMLQKYEGVVAELIKSRQRQTQAEDRANTAETKAKEIDEKLKAANEQIHELQLRKKDLKLQNQALEVSNEKYKEQSEQQYIEIRSLKLKLQELNYLQKLQMIIEEQNEDAHIKQIRMNSAPQRQAQEFYDLYQLKCSQMKGIQNDFELMQQEGDNLKRKLNKQKLNNEDLSKENQQLKEYIKNKKERSTENSVNQITNYLEKKQKQVDQDIIMLTQDTNGAAKKRKPPPDFSKVQFGKNTLLNRPGIQNQIFSQFRQL